MDVQSSYKANNLGTTLYELVTKYQPKRIVEFGVYQGYSTLHFARALRDIEELGGERGHIVGYDLWEKYPYRHTNMMVARQHLKAYGVSEFVTLGYMDFFDWIKQPSHDFDLLHLDISNNGDIIELAFNALKDQVKAGAIIVFEGGSEERDQCDWMINFKKRPINPLQTQLGFEIINPHFPSLSILKDSSVWSN